MKHHLITLLVLITFSGLSTQPSLEVQEDLIHKTSLVAQLPKELDENSGLQYINGYFYTFNDSGGDAKLYKLDLSSGKILQKVQFSETKNQDWEDIAYDGEHLYVADTGNNFGRRKDLTIYKIKLSQIGTDKKTKVPVESIRFSYPEQKTFKYSAPRMTNNFDAEALFYQNGKLHLFTKEWGSYLSTHYTVPIEQGSYEATKIETFDAEGLITGADVSDNKAVMVGYTKDALVFLWKFWNFKDGKYFNGQKKKYILGWAPSIGQVEGVTFKDDTVYISCEYFKKKFFFQDVKQQLYRVSPLD
ncbi:MAG: hypothetical protein ACMUEL_01905 [Flavobacteriales bacterium Tduv]